MWYNPARKQKQNKINKNKVIRTNLKSKFKPFNLLKITL